MTRLTSVLHARIRRHDPEYGLSTLFFGGGELRVPMLALPPDAAVRVEIDARDVSIALSRPMDVSITNRLPGRIMAVERLTLPYAKVVFDLGPAALLALVTVESVVRLALEPGLKAWAMIKTVAISESDVSPDLTASPWPPSPIPPSRIPD